MTDRKEYFKKYWKARRVSHGDDLRARSLSWYNLNKARAKKSARAWCLSNRQHIRDYQKKQRQNPVWKMRRNLGSRLSEVLAKRKIMRSRRLKDLLGCDLDSLRRHLESRFKPGMSWENYGFFGWHVDHVIPCASFDLSTDEGQRRCFHYTNLSPLWCRDNIVKGKKLHLSEL